MLQTVLRSLFVMALFVWAAFFYIQWVGYRGLSPNLVADQYIESANEVLFREKTLDQKTSDDDRDSIASCATVVGKETANSTAVGDCSNGANSDKKCAHVCDRVVASTTPEKAAPKNRDECAAECKSAAGPGGAFPCQGYQWNAGGNGLCQLTAFTDYPPRTYLDANANSGYTTDRIASGDFMKRALTMFAWLGVFALLFVAYYMHYNEPTYNAYATLFPLVGAAFLTISLLFVGPRDTGIAAYNLPCPAGTTCRPDAVGGGYRTATCYNKCCGRSITLDNLTCTWPNFQCKPHKDFITYAKQYNVFLNENDLICAASLEQCDGGVQKMYYGDGCQSIEESTVSVVGAGGQTPQFMGIESMGLAQQGAYAGERDCGRYYDAAIQQANAVGDMSTADKLATSYRQVRALVKDQRECMPPGNRHINPVQQVSFTMTRDRRLKFDQVDTPDEAGGNCGMAVWQGQQQLFVKSASYSRECTVPETIS